MSAASGQSIFTMRGEYTNSSKQINSESLNMLDQGIVHTEERCIEVCPNKEITLPYVCQYSRVLYCFLKLLLNLFDVKEFVRQKSQRLAQIVVRNSVYASRVPVTWQASGKRESVVNCIFPYLTQVKCLLPCGSDNTEETTVINDDIKTSADPE